MPKDLNSILQEHIKDHKKVQPEAENINNVINSISSNLNQKFNNHPEVLKSLHLKMPKGSTMGISPSINQIIKDNNLNQRAADKLIDQMASYVANEVNTKTGEEITTPKELTKSFKQDLASEAFKNYNPDKRKTIPKGAVDLARRVGREVLNAARNPRQTISAGINKIKSIGRS